MSLALPVQACFRSRRSKPMENPWRGEVTLQIDGVPRVMRLTLGALAGLEAELGESSLLSLIERFETRQFSASDVIAVLKAGLSGGGHADVAARIGEATIDGGPVAAAQAAAQVLVRAFAPDGSA